MKNLCRQIIDLFFSSALAFVGMCLGRVLGNLDTVTPWIFTTTAGIFLYVALVDMIPQLHTGNDHKEPKQRAIALFIQVRLQKV